MIRKATKTLRPLRMALMGPTGTGKTYTALTVARALAEGGDIVVVDTEHASSCTYADQFDFGIIDLQRYSFDDYQAAIKEAAASRAKVLVVDSLSHAWAGEGGALSQVDEYGVTHKGDKFGAWRGVTPRQNNLIAVLMAFPGHVIVTMRQKMDYILETNEKGKQAPRKVGLAPVQREGVEYEFDVIVEMLDVDNNALVSKSRFASLHGKGFRKPGADFLTALKAGISEGTIAPAIAAQGPAPTPVAPPLSDHDALVAKKIEALEKVKILGESKGLSEDLALAGLEELEEIRMPIPEQIQWLRARYGDIRADRYPEAPPAPRDATPAEAAQDALMSQPTPPPELTPPAEPVKKRGKAKAAEDARAHLASKEPPPWPQRWRDAVERLRAAALVLGRDPETVLCEIGGTHDDAGEAEQSAWLSAVTVRHRELQEEARLNAQYYGKANGPRPGQHMGD